MLFPLNLINLVGEKLSNDFAIYFKYLLHYAKILIIPLVVIC